MGILIKVILRYTNQKDFVISYLISFKKNIIKLYYIFKEKKTNSSYKKKIKNIFNVVSKTLNLKLLDKL